MSKAGALFLVAAGLFLSSGSASTPTPNDADIVCFVYHRFGDDRFPSTNITLDDFEKHLRYLKDGRFHIVTLGEALNLLKAGHVPPKTVVLSIDDGYRSFLTNGMPLLRKYGFKATLFLNTEQVGLQDFITWDETKALLKAGIEIGNHSHSHAYFVNNKKSEILPAFRSDLQKAEEIFETELGFVPRLYCYPYGEYTQVMKAELERRGYRAAAAQKSGVISTFSDLFALPRFPMTGVYSSFDKFRERVNMRALPVELYGPADPVLTRNNPPVLQLKIVNPGLINTASLQCFVGGETNCTLDYNERRGILTIKNNKPLNARRTLYTVTASSASETGIWHWFSWLWIVPSIEE